MLIESASTSLITSGNNSFTNNSSVSEVSHSNFIGLIHDLDNQVKTSDQAIQDYIFNKGISTHELMITLEATKHDLQVAVEIRNRLIDAYEKIVQIGI